MASESDNINYQKLLERCERLEKERSRRLQVEQEVVAAKNRVDAELARFKVFQRFVGDALAATQDQQLIELTLEAVIEAFECESAVFLQVDLHENNLQIVGEFGLPSPPVNLPYPEEFEQKNYCAIRNAESSILKAWAALEIVQGAVCVFTTQEGDVAGAVVAGNTEDGMDTYELFTEEKLSAFSVLVGEASSLRNNLQYIERIKQSDERNRQIIESALDAVVTVDKQGTITGWNKQADMTFGWSREDAIGRNLVETIFPPDFRQHEKGMARFLETGIKNIIGQRVELTAVDHSGKEFPIELAISTAKLGEKVVFTAFLRDITERKLAEDRLKKQVDSLRKELDEAQYHSALAMQTGTTSFGEDVGAGAQNMDWRDLIAVHSFRGGTGKSCLATQMATLLAAGGKRVGVLDLDVQSPGIHLMFGLNGRDFPNTLNDYIGGHCELEQIAYNVTEALRKPVPGEVWLIPASTQPGQIAQLISQGYGADQLQQVFSRLLAELKLDKLIIDTHPGINEEALLAINNAHHLLIVLRPETLDYEGTGLLVQVAKKLKNSHTMLVANQAPAEQCKSVRQQLEKTFETEVAGVIPYSELVPKCDGAGVFVLENPEHEVTRVITQVLQQTFQG